MIRVSQIKISAKDYAADHEKEYIKRKVIELLHITESSLKDISIVRKSLDARKKDNIRYVYTVDAEVENESQILKSHKKNPDISYVDNKGYTMPDPGDEWMKDRPCIVGAGPAGLFCAYFLALHGFSPVLIEQGDDVDTRKETVDAFLQGRAPLDPMSNIQFGEGGAGTFSDGKLASGIKDINGRRTEVLKILHDNGAPEEILYAQKPHIGTDVLRLVVKNMRERIIANGGSVWFRTKLIDLRIRDGVLTSAVLNRNGNLLDLTCSLLVLAIGHSSKDTYQMLFDKGLEMQAKPFAVGVRAEHLQDDINSSQYGEGYRERYPYLPAADYKLTAHTSDGHSVYSFCMCPGGYVINSSSEHGHLCVNGMSYSKRDGINANSAIVVDVSPEDIGAVNDPLAGVRFQRELEEKAYTAGQGAIPVQRFEDFRNGKITQAYGKVVPQTKGKTAFADLTDILPEFITADLKEAFTAFEKHIAGFSDPDTIISAVESRTSSPVRIVRDTSLESSVKGVYPCGEGAGYAGGITSAAVDGIKVFEEIYKKYRVK